MSTTEFDYYLIDCEIPHDVPLLVTDDEVNPAGTGFLSQEVEVSTAYVVPLRFGPPKVAKPRLIDGMDLSGSCSVFSQKVYDALKPHNFKGLQLVPAIIKDYKNNEHKDHWVANVYQRLALFDKETSKCKWISESTGAWMSVEEIHLDKSLVSKLPLNDRLVFVSEESSQFILYHKSVVDVISSVNPKGITFTSIEEWNERTAESVREENELLEGIDLSFLDE